MTEADTKRAIEIAHRHGVELGRQLALKGIRLTLPACEEISLALVRAAEDGMNHTRPLAPGRKP